MRRRFRVILAVGFVLAAATALALVGGSARHHGSLGVRDGSEDQGLAFARHTEDVPGVADNEGPTTAADEAYELNAYPADSITGDQIAAAQAAFDSVASKGAGKGRNSTAAWFSLGPTDAVYPAFLNRHGSQYVTSGRITALAVTPDCTSRQCTLWVAAAGGGV